MSTGTLGKTPAAPTSTLAVGGDAPGIEVRLPDAEEAGAPAGTAEAAEGAGPLDTGVPAFEAGADAVAAEEDTDLVASSRFAGLKAGWENLRARVGNRLNGLRERTGNMSNPITGPRVKTAGKALGILAAAGLLVVGAKKGYDAMTDGADVTAPVVEPAPVAQSPWTVRAGEMTDAECDMHLMNTRGKDAVIIDCDNIKYGAQICNDEGLDPSDATFKYDAITVKGFQPIPTPENCASGEHLQATLVR